MFVWSGIAMKLYKQSFLFAKHNEIVNKMVAPNKEGSKATKKCLWTFCDPGERFQLPFRNLMREP